MEGTGMSRQAAPTKPETAVAPNGIQTLVGGAAPIMPAQRLANAPMQPRLTQRPADHGLFDLNARPQTEMF